MAVNILAQASVATFGVRRLVAALFQVRPTHIVYTLANPHGIHFMNLPLPR
jgi:hypothetical protein